MTVKDYLDENLEKIKDGFCVNDVYYQNRDELEGDFAERSSLDESVC